MINGPYNIMLNTAFFIDGFKTPQLEYKRSSSSFSFVVLHLILPEAHQPYGLLYSSRIARSNFLHHFRSTTPPEQRKLEL
jgi:hypothetical protein